MAKKESENFLDFIPVKNPDYTWDEKDGIVTVNVVHKGFYSMIAQKFFHTPRVSHIELETHGSFIWQAIDGSATVGQIADKFKQQFGDDAEPLYERLTKYMTILHNNRFVLFKGKDKGV